ncbi:hypothetical protein EVAR_23258_1 [Eumeta japonica]|uniref:Uncharacterized protein n=1 Tax=Eumeta variegata TaxID=151549 RepID=A0A4C1V6K8_EUMVA|nr:hypothetical protein EVAR_23258_1 [Eumeta japonica]
MATISQSIAHPIAGACATGSEEFVARGPVPRRGNDLPLSTTHPPKYIYITGNFGLDKCEGSAADKMRPSEFCNIRAFVYPNSCITILISVGTIVVIPVIVEEIQIYECYRKKSKRSRKQTQKNTQILQKGDSAARYRRSEFLDIASCVPLGYSMDIARFLEILESHIRPKSSAGIAENQRISYLGFVYIRICMRTRHTMEAAWIMMLMLNTFTSPNLAMALCHCCALDD